ncbi:hypothetical protein FQN49_001191 [Arthroderma sp. PD_2]|nr:hypothetical protein FQN49_001191 [Arthroderma sp. PD_2]
MLFQISSRKDLVRPSRRQSSKYLAHSRKEWQSLLAFANSKPQFPETCYNLCSLLYRTPSIPDSTKVCEVTKGTASYLEGYSQWKIPSDTHCDLNTEMKESSCHKVYVGVNKPALCKTSDEFLSTWAGFETSPNTSAGNYLFAFVLGWAYVLSARLVELRQTSEDDNIFYTTDQSPTISPDMSVPTGHFPISIGQVNAAECRWWQAILANGCGWQAILRRQEKNYYTPWTCHLDDNEAFVILQNGPAHSFDSSSLSGPPSSTEAQHYLEKFACLHNAYDQLLAGFVAALTIPSHLQFGAPVILPRPRPMGTWNVSTESTYAPQIARSNQICHLMLLSCLSNAIPSSLFGCFWEPDVKCNLTSEWLHPPLHEVLPTLLEKGQCHIIVRMMAARRPNTAPLWLGAAVTGLLPRMISICRSYLPPTLLETSVWTSSSLSFMDPDLRQDVPISHNTAGQEIISREDEFRLLYLTDFNSEVYKAPPLSPYAPFGEVSLEQCALEVRLHVSCGHRLAYHQWIWKGQNDQKLCDNGIWLSETVLSTKPTSVECSTIDYPIDGLLLWLRRRINELWRLLQSWIKDPCSEDLSKASTRNNFSWTFFADGIRRDELRMWDHEWLRSFRERQPNSWGRLMSSLSESGLQNADIYAWINQTSDADN